MKHGFIKTAAAAPAIRVADPSHNADAIIRCMEDAHSTGVKILVLPELCLTGSTCGDLFFRDSLLMGAEVGLHRILKETKDLDVLCAFGLPLRAEGRLYNCAAMVHKGKLLGLTAKADLTPSQGRWFTPPVKGAPSPSFCFRQWDGTECRIALGPVCVKCAPVPGLVAGMVIGSDAHTASALTDAGVSMLLHLSAEPAMAGRVQAAKSQLLSCSARLGCAIVSANAGEGESSTDHVFDGHCLIAEGGELLAERRFASGLCVSEPDVQRLAAARRKTAKTTAEHTLSFRCCETGFIPCQTQLTRDYSRLPFVPRDEAARRDRWEELLTIQTLGLKKRLEHTGAKKAVIGLSGGLDSTLALLITVRAYDLLGLPRSSILAITMPCFGTTDRTRSNAWKLGESLGVEMREIDIGKSVTAHFEDIGHDPKCQNVVFENAQARERTQVLMDVANGIGAPVIGTGDLSELALGWATYNGDHMSMYGVNAGIPKTLVRHLTAYCSETCENKKLAEVLSDILDTPVSPELLPAQDGVICQRTEDLVGPYELHDFFLFHMLGRGAEPEKLLRLGEYAFKGLYSRDTVLKWLRVFLNRFFSQQFKRSCLPDGPCTGPVNLSPRDSWQMPSDASPDIWLKELDNL